VPDPDPCPDPCRAAPSKSKLIRAQTLTLPDLGKKTASALITTVTGGPKPPNGKHYSTAPQATPWSTVEYAGFFFGFFYYFSSGTLQPRVQDLPVKALVLQSWAVTPEMAARPYSGSFSSLGQSPVPPLPHIPSCPTAPLIAPPKLWQICGPKRWRHCYLPRWQ
jgi:hypothetical protein